MCSSLCGGARERLKREVKRLCRWYPLYVFDNAFNGKGENLVAALFKIHGNMGKNGFLALGLRNT